MKVALYARVSTHDQDEALQIPRLESYCARMEYQISKVYTDEASGRDANRPGWKALLSDARRGEFEAVIVTKLDRIMRSLTQLLDILQDFEKRHISIITLDQGIIVLGRPVAKLPIHTIALMRVAGKSWRSISLELRIPRSTLKNYRKEIEEECITVAESLYKKCPSCGSNLSYVPDLNYWCCTNCNYLEGRQ